MNGINSQAMANAILVTCALIVTGMLVRREMQPLSTVGAAATTRQNDWRSYAASGHTMGPADAPVTIVEFADFECPYCREFRRDADSLRALGKSFKVIYRHFPLRSHRFALPAVRASECADAQGRFDSMSQTLYKYADSLGVVPWEWFARKAGVTDSAQFVHCIASHTPIAALGRDTLAGHRLNVTGTPVLLIGSLRTRGVPSFDSLAAYIDRAATTSKHQQ